MAYLDDLMYEVLASHYGGTTATHTLSDLRDLFVQDYPEYLTNRRRQFFKDQLDALHIEYSPSAHCADLAHVFWQNFVFGESLVDHLLLEDGSDFLLENGAQLPLEVTTGLTDDFFLEDGTQFLLEDGTTPLSLES